MFRQFQWCCRNININCCQCDALSRCLDHCKQNNVPLSVSVWYSTVKCLRFSHVYIITWPLLFISFIKHLCALNALYITVVVRHGSWPLCMTSDPWYMTHVASVGHCQWSTAPFCCTVRQVRTAAAIQGAERPVSRSREGYNWAAQPGAPLLDGRGARHKGA